MFDVGERSAPAWLVIEGGSIEVVGRDGLDREVAITSHGAGQISGELRQLTGRAALAGNLKPAKDNSTERIDGIVALTMAIGRLILPQEAPRRRAVNGQNEAAIYVVLKAHRQELV